MIPSHGVRSHLVNGPDHVKDFEQPLKHLGVPDTNTPSNYQEIRQALDKSREDLQSFERFQVYSKTTHGNDKVHPDELKTLHLPPIFIDLSQ